MPSHSTRFLVLVGVTAVGLAGYACGGGSPAGPTSTDAGAARVQGGDGPVSSEPPGQEPPGQETNNAPVLVYKTTPRHVSNEIFGKAPLQVKINVCNSSDPDEGDSLRSDVEWGDGVETGPHGPGAGTDPQDGNTTGCGGPDCCRHRHEYRDPGRYTIKIKLTDKHLEDQGQDVESLALTTATLIAKVGEDAPAATSFAFESTDVPKDDEPSGAPADSVLLVSGLSDLSVSDVNVNMYVTSTFGNDMSLALLGPTGASSSLFVQRGAFGPTTLGNSCGDRLTFDDEAATAIGAAAGSATFTGSFRPETPLSVFDGVAGDGTWRLRVSETFGDGGDIIQCWGLAIEAQ